MKYNFVLHENVEETPINSTRSIVLYSMRQTIKTNKLKHAYFFIFFLLGLTFIFSSCKKKESNPIRVKEFSIHSNNTGSDYGIWVVLPQNYDSNLIYETIYVLDANEPTMSYDKIAKFSEAKSAKYRKQNAIVVGINNEKKRERDFLPFDTIEGQGGSVNYAKFIEFELIPKIESKYSVDTAAKSRVLMGFSYGGLLTCFFYTKHPNVFHNYITLSPPLKPIQFQYEEDTRLNNVKIKTLVFIGCGEFERTIAARGKEWHDLLSAYYPNCKLGFNLLEKSRHGNSALGNAEIGIDFYYQNK